ncbi:MAG TPA: hypothetical protein VHV30_05855 [Polyangiaceae bacterium]|jgi:hypothetical protein|nr:hypothetical protein [Polyangiaceae bacterium]
MVWDPKRITPKSWAEVVAFYRHLEDRNDDFRPLRALAERIAEPSYGASLFPAVSGTALLITRHAGADWAQDGLRIDVGLSASLRFVVPRPGAAKPTTLETDNLTLPALVATFEGLLAQPDWG